MLDWFIIVAALIMAGASPNLLTLSLALALIGCRQLSLGIIVHETGHQTFFKSRALNDFVGRWLSGYWVFSSKKSYMEGHLKHHQYAGTPNDPDLKNYAAYPVSKSSFRRKVWRDLSGKTGWRRLKSIGRSIRRYPSLDRETQRVIRGGLITNSALLGVLSLIGQPWLYLLWVLAFITTHMLSTRLRQVGEHAGVPDSTSSDPRQNTRTVLTRWWERLFISPHQISYHLEHHLLPSVPIYQLPKLHQLLVDHQYYQAVGIVQGYPALIRAVTRSH
ncbi:MAG: fatty acid desaturase family protein [Pseudomonadales bacterium]